jgi:hypothetical protein
LSVEEATIHQLEEMGPVDYVVIEFPDGVHKGEAAPLLVDLVDRGIIRILDLILIRKNEDGTVSGLEIADLDGDGVSDFRVFEGASSGLMSDEEREEAGNILKPGAAALVIMFENRWAAPFGKAMREAGGQLAAFGRIPTQGLLAALEAAEGRA